jgi:hypothetical protein
MKTQKKIINLKQIKKIKKYFFSKTLLKHKNKQALKACLIMW